MRLIAGAWFLSSSAPPDAPAQTCRSMLEEAGTAAPIRIASHQAGLAAGVRAVSGALSPENPTDHQPLHHARATLVADLRLDNRDELARRLSLSNAQLSQMSDAQLLLQAWLAWGETCVDRLIGGFAFACWNESERRLFLARDLAGEKPLFFSRLPDRFLFASRSSAVGRGLPQAARIDERRFAEFLTGVDAFDSATFLPPIEQLQPGNCLRVTPNRSELRRYWDPDSVPQIRHRTHEAYLDDFRERFDSAVAARLRSTAPVGALLSSGLDSSSVAATAARLLAPSGRRLTAFTAVPLPDLPPLTWPGRFADEGPAAAEAAAFHPNMDHITLNAGGQEIVRNLERHCFLNGEPPHNLINTLWMSAILDRCRQLGIRALLTGAGGNATISFGGLPVLSKIFREGRWLPWARAVYRLRAHGHTSWRGAAAHTFGPLASVLRGFSRPAPLASSPLRPEIQKQYRLPERAADQARAIGRNWRFGQRRLYQLYNPGPVNAGVALGWGIELRDPTFDRRIVEFCFGIPPEQFIAGGHTRSLVRRGMAGRLPESTLKRTRRGIQGADWALIMAAQRTRLASELARTEGSPLARRLLDLARLRRLLDTWPARNFEDVAVSDAYHLALTRGLAAGRFLTLYDPDFQNPQR